MSIRLRLTLLYTAILTLTLIVFGVALYLIQSQFTMNSLKSDLSRTGDNLGRSILWMYLHPRTSGRQTPPRLPIPLEILSGPQALQELREREIVRVLDASGGLVASPLAGDEQPFPIQPAGFQALQGQQVWWEIQITSDDHLLIYDRPVVNDGQLIFIVQVARSLTERDRSLAALSRTLLVASLLTIMIAFGVGWMIAGAALRPIHRITQTAQAIGNESDFTRRVDYNGPGDEIGELAKTFNSMLSRLQEAYQRVSQALNMQRDFVADVSHELRTPLTTVRGNLALLRRDPPLPQEEQVDILSDLEGESDRLIALVNNLLVLARADARHGLEREPVSIRNVIEEVVRQAGHLDGQREIITSAAPLAVMGDRNALKQVLLILLDNTLKYSQGTIRVTSDEVQDQAVIAIQDEGPGMSPETIQHVFDRFYRGEVGTSIPGFGLGLPIAKALVEGQSGALTIESQPEQGTVVRVWLPLARTDA